MQYGDVAVWQRDWLSGEVLDAQLGWWRERLAGAPPLLELPTDRPRSAAPAVEGGSVAFVLPEETAAALRALSRREGATLFMTLLAAWQVLLSRWSGQDDVAVGTPVAGRTRLETEGLIGFFVNTLVLRTDLSGEPSFRDLLGRVREATLGAYAHQDVPFEKLVEELAPERSLSHTPFFQAMLVLQNAPPRAGCGWARCGRSRWRRGRRRPSSTSRSCWRRRRARASPAPLSYRADLFDAATVRADDGPLRRAAARGGGGAGPARARGAHAARGGAGTGAAGVERDGRAGPRGGVHPPAASQAQAARTPRRAAPSSSASRRMTYRELNERANRLAHHLRAARGGAGDAGGDLPGPRGGAGRVHPGRAQGGGRIRAGGPGVSGGAHRLPAGRLRAWPCC